MRKIVVFLAMALLTSCYQNGKLPEKAHLVLNQNLLGQFVGEIETTDFTKERLNLNDWTKAYLLSTNTLAMGLRANMNIIWINTNALSILEAPLSQQNVDPPVLAKYVVEDKTYVVGVNSDGVQFPFDRPTQGRYLEIKLKSE